MKKYTVTAHLCLEDFETGVEAGNAIVECLSRGKAALYAAGGRVLNTDLSNTPDRLHNIDGAILTVSFEFGMPFEIRNLNLKFETIQYLEPLFGKTIAQIRAAFTYELDLPSTPREKEKGLTGGSIPDMNGPSLPLPDPKRTPPEEKPIQEAPKAAPSKEKKKWVDRRPPRAQNVMGGVPLLDG